MNGIFESIIKHELKESIYYIDSFFKFIIFFVEVIMFFNVLNYCHCHHYLQFKWKPYFYIKTILNYKIYSITYLDKILLDYIEYDIFMIISFFSWHFIDLKTINFSGLFEILVWIWFVVLISSWIFFWLQKLPWFFIQNC